MDIKIINNPDIWDRYVFQSKTSKYTHLFNWSRVIEDVFGHKAIYLAAVRSSREKNFEIQGILPLFRFKALNTAYRLVSIPFFDTAGILTQEVSIPELFFKKGFIPLLKSSSPSVSDLVLRQDRPLNMPDETLMGKIPGLFSGKVGLALSIQKTEQEMIQAFKSKLRSQIKKSERCGLTWEIGKARLIDPFYTVFSRNMRDLGSPVHPKKLFHSIFHYFRSHAFICVVFYRSEPVAASFMFRFKKTLSNPWASSLRPFRHLNANLYMYWQMIRFACRLKAETFDMGRSSKNATTYLFKKQFCPDEHPIYWYTWSFNGKAWFAPEETLTLPGWKHLPLGMANILGPMIRKRISL